MNYRRIAAPLGVMLLAMCMASGCNKPTGESGSASTTPAAASEPLKLAVAIATEDGAAGTTVAPNYFHGKNGDKFQLILKPQREGFCYVINEGSSGNTMMIFPNRSWGLTSNLVKAGSLVAVPSPDQWLALDDAPGTENLTVVYAGNRIDSLEAIYGETEPSSESIQNALSDLAQQAPPGAGMQESTTESEAQYTTTGGATVMQIKLALRHE